MAVGWKKLNGAWYYFNPSGHMITGWLKVDGKYYYLNPSDGKMISNGSCTINNINYTFDQDGVCQNEASAIDGGSAGSVYSSPSAGSNAGNGITAVNPNGSSNTPGNSNASYGMPAAPGNTNSSAIVKTGITMSRTSAQR